MQQMKQVRLVGGPYDGEYVGSNKAHCHCSPVAQLDEAGDITKWVVALYKPDGDKEETATFDKIIEWAEDIYTTPIDKTLFDDIVKQRGTLLELGSGTTTSWFKEKRDVISIEDNLLFYGLFNHWSKTILCPCDNVTSFYNKGMLKRLLKGIRYSTLLIDGPDGDHRLTGFMGCYELFDRAVDWYFDDWELDLVQPHLIKLAAELSVDLLEVHTDCKKPWAVIRGRKI